MANKKITALDNLPSPAGADILPIVDDVSGTPTTKKVTATNLMTLAPVQSVAGRTGTVTLSNSDISGLGTAATSASTDFSPAFFTTVAESTTARTLSDSDNGKVIVCSNSATVIVTIPTGLTAGFSCTIVQSGTGTVQVEGGATIYGLGSKTATAGQYAALNVIPIGTNIYVLEGDGQTPPFVNDYSIDLDGANDYIDAGTISGILVGTVSAWFKADATISKSTPDYLVGLGDGDEGITFGGDSIFGPADDGIITVTTGNHLWSYANSSATINTNWHHVAIVWATSSSTNSGNAGYDIYLDGSIVGNHFATYSSGNGSQLTADRVRVGARDRSGAATYNFAGLVDELSIFTASLSSSDITAIYNSGSPDSVTSYSPALWWRMGDNDGGTGTTITDQGSGGNNGTLTNGPTFSSTTP